MAKIVLHIHHVGLGGAERVALHWLNWLHQEGHQVWLLLGDASTQEFFSVPEGVTVLLPPAGSGFGKVPTAIWLWRVLSQLRPDCAIGMTARPALNLLLASAGRSWPVLVAERNFPPAKPLPAIWVLLRRCLYPKARLHLVQTERIGAWLETQGLARRLICVPNSVHWPLAEQEPRLSPDSLVPGDAHLLLGVGTKPQQKGFDRLLIAFSRLPSHASGWWLVLPGVSEDHPQIQAILEQIPGSKAWRHRLVLPGRIGNLQIWYERADLFILSSRYEGFPNVLLEAMAAGCACLAFDCPTGPRELIEHQKNGWLLDLEVSEIKQQREFERSLWRLMKDPQLRQQLGHAASEVRSSFSEVIVRQRFLAAVNSCLEPTVLVFAPTRRSPTETFVRANLASMPLEQIAYFGDEFGVCSREPLFQRLAQLAYGTAVLISKICTRLGWQRLSTICPSLVAWGLIRSHRPGVVLAEFGFHAVRMMDAAKWSGIPLVVHFRGADAFADRRVRWLGERYRRLMQLSEAFIVKSQPMKMVLEAYGAPRASITISPSGADQELFKKADPAAASPTVLFVGRLVEKKAPLDALEAFAEACRSSSIPSRLVMIGEGPLRTAVEAKVRALGLETQVMLLGLQTPIQVAKWMRSVRCLLLPSRVASDGDSEGCPVVVLEAQVAGLPVVATRHAGIPEVVLEGRTAFLAAEGDVQVLARGLAQLLEDPAMAGRMGSEARDYAGSRFTVAHHISTVADVLRSAARIINADKAP